MPFMISAHRQLITNVACIVYTYTSSVMSNILSVTDDYITNVACIVYIAIVMSYMPTSISAN